MSQSQTFEVPVEREERENFQETLKNDFLAFLDPEQNQEHHGQEYDIAIDDMLETGSKRISINLNHLRGFIPPKFEGNLAESILKQPRSISSTRRCAEINCGE